MSHKVFIYDKVYIPQCLVTDASLLAKYWEFPVFDEPLCRPCDNKPNRLNNQCKTCPGYLKTIKMWSTHEGKNGLKYYTLPAGCIGEVFKRLRLDYSQFVVDDRRCNLDFTHPLSFTGDLFTGEVVDGVATANQQYIVNKWLEVGSGIIEAQPRTGKTVMATYLSCFLGKKTIIVAHQEELLQNFYKTFENLTNLKELRLDSGKEIVRLVKKVSDLDKEDYDVILVNYQKFIKDETGKARIDKYLKNRYSFLIIDECHSAAASCFSKFANQLTPRYSLGLSATPDRKDCVEGSTKIHTEIGILTMEEIVSRFSRGEKLRVYSFNQESKEIELKPILEVHRKTVDAYREITLLDDQVIRVTIDHEFL